MAVPHAAPGLIQVEEMTFRRDPNAAYRIVLTLPNVLLLNNAAVPGGPYPAGTDPSIGQLVWIPQGNGVHTVGAPLIPNQQYRVARVAAGGLGTTLTDQHGNPVTFQSVTNHMRAEFEFVVPAAGGAPALVFQQVVQPPPPAPVVVPPAAPATAMHPAM